MKVYLAFCLIVTAFAAVDDSLKQVLRSPQATLKLYQNFKTNEHLSFGPNEDGMRFRLFYKNAQFVVESNDEVKDTAEYGLNFFSFMTDDEKIQYLGLNMTGHENHAVVSSLPSAPGRAPSKKLWTNVKAVTEVKNQGSCGSCWTYGAVGGLETRYQQLSGRLRNFAEQEYLDCVYDGKEDGCQGGWPEDAYKYSADNGGRLAATIDYKYKGKDGKCLSKKKRNALVAYKITGFTNIGQNEAANIDALLSGSLSVAFEVTSKFQQYRRGIMKDTTCKSWPNHAVTAVGYTKDFVLVKNSWGSSWGEQGFVKFARNYHNCGLFEYSSYPKLASTGKKDSGKSDKATDYTPDGNPEPEPTPECKDKRKSCARRKTYYCKKEKRAKRYCQKTCGICSAEDCPSGTIKCPDGVCRHEHMC